MFKTSFKVILTGITLPGIYETTDYNICCKYLGVSHSNKRTKNNLCCFCWWCIAETRPRARTYTSPV